MRLLRTAAFLTWVGIVALTMADTLAAQSDAADLPPPEETEIWQPVPPLVTPGPYLGPAEPPSDAIVLFDGDDLDEWVAARDGSAASWSVADGAFTVDKSVGDIHTRRRFGSFQIHLEWRIPTGITGEGQGRGNSGLYLAWDNERREGYELQILDSYQNETYVNGMAGSVYKQAIPLANAMRPPGEWQVYDVVWTAPSFDSAGRLVSPARVTAFLNGVLVQNDVELIGETVYRGAPEYYRYDDAPIMLQSHGDPSPPISFRNIWLRELER